MFYMLYEGKVEVQKAGLEKKPVLSRGEFFSEQALLHGRPRSLASIVALADCTATLGKEDFNEMVTSLNLTDAMEDESETCCDGDQEKESKKVHVQTSSAVSTERFSEHESHRCRCIRYGSSRET